MVKGKEVSETVEEMFDRVTLKMEISQRERIMQNQQAYLFFYSTFSVKGVSLRNLIILYKIAHQIANYVDMLEVIGATKKLQYFYLQENVHFQIWTWLLKSLQKSGTTDLCLVALLQTIHLRWKYEFKCYKNF